MVLIEKEGVPVSVENQVSGAGRRGGSTHQHGGPGKWS